MCLALIDNRVTEPFFDGVYSKDNLVDIESKPRLVISNTACSSQLGKHWVLFFFKGETVEFYDSLGKDLFHYGLEFQNFAFKFARTVKQTGKRTQPENSKLCGAYCLFYAYWRCKGKSMKEIINCMGSPGYVRKVVKSVFTICKSSHCKLLQNCLPW